MEIWVETTREVYLAVYQQHFSELRCAESYTEMDEQQRKLKAQITAWAFTGADYPIIRSELRNYDEWSYYLYRGMKGE